VKRIGKIRNMTAEEIAELIISAVNQDLPNKYCKGDCTDTWDEPICQDELGCCIKWLEEEVE
jgi:hypothetical protein